ncbi:hypothetical protein C0J52_04652 [Blattella germanica]|nr:hypothetical protein C0J52_04652 [Blattella germanica]
MIFDLFQECKEEIGDVGKQNEGPCLFECAGKKLEVLDEDGKMKAEEYVELCQKMAEGDEQLEEHIKEVCTTQAEKTKDFPENIQDKYKCKLDMLIAFQGTHIEILLNCPAELKNNDAECEKMRESMKKQIQQAQG